VKVFLVCTGVGVISRGIETFARECFDGLHGRIGLHIELFKGAGAEAPEEHRLWNLPRTGHAAAWMGRLIRRNSYVAEQLSSFLPLVRAIRRGRPDIVFYSDSNLGFQLHRWRRCIGVPFRLLFSNGGPCGPPFDRTDHVQQVAPYYRERALRAGEPASKQSLVPYGITVPSGPPLTDPAARRELRRRLDLPVYQPIVLSVGWISAAHKRMDYLIREVASLPPPRPFLLMLGHIDAASPPVLHQAREMLGPTGFAARSVPYADVSPYYQTADLFTLASLQEGFGRVYLEALLHGLPAVVHDHPVTRYVLGPEGTFAALNEPGALSVALRESLSTAPDPGSMARRREYVRRRFSWDTLAPAYLDMFRACSAA
jgi:glycosyltransferase involved in cell wall biosynthesis